MNNNEYIKKEIKNYIECKATAGALLLNGEWGSGKSYIVKKIAESEDLSKKYYFVIVSLFGINSIDELDLTVKKVMYLPHLNGEGDSKILDGLKKLLRGLSIISENAEKANAFISNDIYDFIEIKNEIETTDGMKKVVLVFDDLERHSKNLEIKLLFGKLNEYIENQGIKTIIISNEDKLQSENDFDQYKEIKEKIISTTIKIKTQYITNSISNIVKTYETSHTEYHSFIESNLENKIIPAFIDSQTSNLRHLKSFLINFERIYISLPFDKYREYLGHRYEEDFNKLLSEVIYNSLVYYLEYMNSEKNESNEEFINRIKSSPNYSLFNKNIQLNSIVKWILSNDYSETEIADEIQNLVHVKTTSDFFLTNYDTFEDGTYIDNIKAWIQRSKVSKLSLTRDGWFEGFHANTPEYITVYELYLLALSIDTLKKDNVQIEAINKFDESEIKEKFNNLKDDIKKHPPKKNYLDFLDKSASSNSNPIIKELKNLNLFLEDRLNAEKLKSMIKNKEWDPSIINEIEIINFDNELSSLISEEYKVMKNVDRIRLIDTFKKVNDKILKSNKLNPEQIESTKQNLDKLYNDISEFNTDKCTDKPITTKNNNVFIKEIEYYNGEYIKLHSSN